ncbi:MAG: ADP-ribosylglycohydrolase family protein [Fibrobacterota bacterium]
MTLENKIRKSLYGAILGDALGVPVEHSTRQELALCSVKNMLGYGRYDQPKGTWSDDSSMILCTCDALLDDYNLDRIARNFERWLFEGFWTPYGHVFDSGLTTVTALESFRSGVSAYESGQKTIDDNGNGSLMRILPAALYFSDLPVDDFIEKIHEICAITHGHARAKTGCGIYSLIIRRLLCSPTEKLPAIHQAVDQARQYYAGREPYDSELSHFSRIINHQIAALKEADIHSSGYVVDTLEASLWCFLRHYDTKSILLSAINLGLDTDTTATVAGGLAGLVYGLDSIPSDWLSSLARKNDIDQLIHAFAETIIQNRVPGDL